jgi:hypothetical protein
LQKAFGKSQKIASKSCYLLINESIKEVVQNGTSCIQDHGAAKASSEARG